MNRLAICVAAAGLALVARPGNAQTKTIQGEAKTMTVTVEAIDHSRRDVTVKKPDGTYDVYYIPKNIARFDTLKVGDTINARYYENLVLQLKAPGDKAVDTAAGAVTKATGDKTGATSARQRTITATIAAIDPAVPSITFTGPNGWKYTSKVEDKKALEKVKVGDRVDITWTEALLLSIDDAKK